MRLFADFLKRRNPAAACPLSFLVLRSIRPRFPDLLLLVLLGISLVGVGFAGQGPARDRTSLSHLSLPDHELLREGDVVLRRGKGIISESLRHFSLQDPSYSHAGILVREQDRWMVVHAIGGEDNPTDKLKKESLAAFCRSDLSSAMGIIRLDLTPADRVRLKRIVERTLEAGPYFDSDFDLASDDRLYCTEFVYKAVLAATGDRKFLPLTRLSGREYVACDNLYLNEHARIIYSYSSNRK